MFAPTFLSDTDRDRLVAINQLLITGLSVEERDSLNVERQELMTKRKDLAQCTVEELHELRQQLFTQYQKHTSIGSKQVHNIANFIKQVEYREMLIQLHHVKEPEKTDETTSTNKKGRSRVSTKRSSYNWTVDIDGDN